MRRLAPSNASCDFGVSTASHRPRSVRHSQSSQTGENHARFNGLSSAKVGATIQRSSRARIRCRFNGLSSAKVGATCLRESRSSSFNRFNGLSSAKVGATTCVNQAEAVHEVVSTASHRPRSVRRNAQRNLSACSSSFQRPLIGQGRCDHQLHRARALQLEVSTASHRPRSVRQPLA